MDPTYLGDDGEDFLAAGTLTTTDLFGPSSIGDDGSTLAELFK
jgi:hypothetical protein